MKEKPKTVINGQSDLLDWLSQEIVTMQDEVIEKLAKGERAKTTLDKIKKIKRYKRAYSALLVI